MNAMVHDMTWNVIQETEGDQIQAISDAEVEEVSGGWFWIAAAVVGAGVSGFGVGLGVSYWANR